MKRILSNFGAMPTTSAATQTAHAFSGEDPVFGHLAFAPCDALAQEQETTPARSTQ